ncbi:MAG: AAA family ATPase [Chloroflexi bacterium]|nr:AAA family ATPase [Chloroflexota bacterium]
MAACRACGASLSETARFCPDCGSPVAARCPRCGAANDPSARFCASCGGPLGGPQPFAEERKVVTILFADITGSTSMGEQLDPERMRSLLRTYFSSMSEVIESWGGRLEKFIGDAIMAAFGVPTAREDDAERALRAALEMLERLETLNLTFRERHGTAMQIRIGVNTGEVIAPVDPNEQLVLAGDAVNVAARLEQAAEPGTVLVGERTYLAARNAFEFDPAVELSLKGKAGAVPARRLLGVVAEPSRGLPGIRAQLVGRDRELRTITELLDEAIETARPRMVLLNGPAGIGKSRLMQEFVRHATESRGEIRILRGRCLPAGHGITYWALGEVLRSFAGISLDDPADDARRKLHDSAIEILGGLNLTDDEARRTIHALAMTAALSLPDNPLEGLEPEAVAAELGRAWPRFVTALAARAATVIVIEDVHWAGDQLVEMLDRLLTRSSGPLLILITARQEFAEAHPRFGAGSDHASIVSLRPLTEQQSGELIGGLLDDAELPHELRDEILAKAEGNPFFVEEMVRRLIDENALIHDSGGWHTTGAALTVALPDSVHALLAARIDALPLREKRVLQEASVIGRIFWQAPVERSAGNGAVAPALLALEQRGLVLARPTSTIAGEPEYIFKHALVRDVAYASLPKARRARAHADAGAWIENLAGDRIEEFAELVAHHYHTAVAGQDSDLAWEDDDAGREGVRAKALGALITAGAGARRRYGINKALELHEAALALAVTDEERASALEELGDDHYGVYHCDEALAALRESLALAAGPAGRERRVRVATKIGRTCARWGAFRVKPDPAMVEEIVTRGLEEADTEETRTSLLILRAQAHLFWYSSEREGDPVPLEVRIAWAQEALEMAERLGEPMLLSRAVTVLSSLLWRRGSFAESLDVNLRLLDLVDQQPSRDVQADTFASLSDDLLFVAGEPDRAVDLAERGYRLALGTSDHELMHTTAPLMRALFWAGRWSEVPALIDAHLAAFVKEKDMSCPEVQAGPPFAARFYAETGDVEHARAAAALVGEGGTMAKVRSSRRTMATVVADMAQYALTTHRMDEALALTGDALDTAGPAELRHIAPTRIEVLVALGRWDELRELIERARPLVDATPLLKPIIQRAEGSALLAAGDPASATESLRAAVAEFERLRYPFEVARTLEALAELVDPPEVTDLRAKALAIYEALGARPHVGRVQAALRGGRPTP